MRMAESGILSNTLCWLCINRVHYCCGFACNINETENYWNKLDGTAYGKGIPTPCSSGTGTRYYCQYFRKFVLSIRGQRRPVEVHIFLAFQANDGQASEAALQFPGRIEGLKSYKVINGGSTS